MIKKITATVLLLCFLTVDVFASVPGISAACAVVIDAKSGEVLYEKNKDERRGPASTTKIMTAITALEYAKGDTVITTDRRAVGTEGSSLYLKTGDKLKLEDLLYALMLQSANDAAETVAYGLCGSIEKFVGLMNEKCGKLGLTDTHFENPHGLDGETHYTTCYELAKITAYAINNEQFRKIVSTKIKNLQIGERNVTLVNHNRLLREYNDITGVKTGFTKKCGRTLVSSARRENVELICVTLGAPDDWRDHRAMLDYAFSLYEFKTLAQKNEFNIILPDGSIAYNKEEITVGSRIFGEINTKIAIEPCRTSDECGSVSFYDGEKFLGEIKLYTG